MRVLLASHHYPPDRFGGVELVTLRTARWLRRQGHDVSVVTIERATEGAWDRVVARDDVYEDVPVTRLTIDLFAPEAPWAWRYRHPILEEWFGGHMERERPDVVHIQSCYLLSTGLIHAAAAAALPTVVSLHDYWFMCPRLTMLRPDGACCAGAGDDAGMSGAAGTSGAGCAWCLMTEQRRYRYLDAATFGVAGGVATRLLRARPVARALAGATTPEAVERRRSELRQALALADALVTPSEYLRRLLLAWGLPEDRVHLVAHGLELAPARLAAPARPAAQDVPAPGAGDTLRLAYLGQVIPAKGLHVLLDAYRQLRTAGRAVSLSVHGGGTDPAYERRMKQMAGAAEGVHWRGSYAPGDVWSILRDVDVVIVPSLWREIGPLVMYEALAAGRPVVASDLPNMQYVVRHEGNGLLFRPGDARDLARQLARLADEERLVGRLREGIAPPRDVADEMAELMTVYREAVVRRESLPRPETS